MTVLSRETVRAGLVWPLDYERDIDDCATAGNRRKLTLTRDGTEKSHNNDRGVVAATNNPEKIDVALRRAGRLDREIRLEKPDLAGC